MTSHWRKIEVELRKSAEPRHRTETSKQIRVSLHLLIGKGVPDERSSKVYSIVNTKGLEEQARAVRRVEASQQT